jgi:hypothetical protein
MKNGCIPEILRCFGRSFRRALPAFLGGEYLSFWSGHGEKSFYLHKKLWTFTAFYGII